MILRFLTRLVVPAAAVFAVSCTGYHIGASKPARLANVHTIAVPNFKNMTLDPRIDVFFTNALISRMQEDGTYKVARSGAADAILECTITSMERRQLRSARFNTLRSRELGLRAMIEYKLIDAATQQVLVQGNVRGESTVFADANFQNAERQAVPEVASNAADSLVSRLSEGW